MYPNILLILLYSVNTFLSYTYSSLKSYRECTCLKPKVTVNTINLLHGHKLKCLNKLLTSKFDDACCDGENPQTPSCKMLVQEADDLWKETQLKAELLPDELITNFLSIILDNIIF